MKKKLFAILLSIVMVAGLLPTVAFAAENYNLCLLYTSDAADE